MRLENLVLKSFDPPALGRFWGEALGLTALTDTATTYEGRLTVPDGPWLDVCLEKVSELHAPGPRLHLDLAGGAAVVERVLGLGASRMEVGQQDVPWTVLGDPEGNPFCVLDQALDVTGPIASVPIDSADPGRDAAFWAQVSGWEQDGSTVRHPSGRGPTLGFWPEPRPKLTQNRWHLDVRADQGEDLLSLALSLGATRVDHDWGELPWTVLADLSGNEFCVLLAPAVAVGQRL